MLSISMPIMYLILVKLIVDNSMISQDYAILFYNIKLKLTTPKIFKNEHGKIWFKIVSLNINIKLI